MPRTKIPETVKVQRIIRQYPQEFSQTPNSLLFCTLCNCNVPSDKTFHVDRHRASSKHQSSITQQSSSATSSIQSFISAPDQNDFSSRVTKAFLSADIPLHKLRNPELRNLFKSINNPLPAESVSRERVNFLYVEEIKRLTDHFLNKPVFIMADESEIRDVKYFNILVGLVEEPSKTYLVDCVPSTKSPDHKFVLQCLLDAIQFFQIKRSDFALFISDAAKYNILAGERLKELFPSVMHVTCIAHLFHNCAMKIKTKFENVDSLIARVKALTTKNRSRQSLFDVIGQPPQPIVTRWGSWINASLYYAEKLPQVRAVVEAIKESGLIVRNAKESVRNVELNDSLCQISSCYAKIPEIIARLESSSFSIAEAYEIVKTVNFGSDPCQIKEYIRKRMERSDLLTIAENGTETISPMILGQLRKCQPTSGDVERSFSILKKILANDRNFLPENVKKYAILKFNSNQ